MKNGNWVPISKCFLNYLPKDRPYTRVEAAFSLQMDYDDGNKVTIRGYAHLWGWSVGKVYRFLKEMNVQIKYPEDTKKKQNQNGTIMNTITERSDKKNGTIRLIENKELQDQTKRYGEKSGTKAERSRNTTNILEPNPNKSLCPQQQIVDLYHTKLPELPKVKVWSEERQRSLRSRWIQAVSNNNGLKSNCIEWWDGFFDFVHTSDFLMGRVDPPPGKKRFRANLEWLVKKANFVKTLEGIYHN